MITKKGLIDQLCDFVLEMLNRHPELRKSPQEAARVLAVEYRKIYETAQNAPPETAASLESGPLRMSGLLLRILLGSPNMDHAARWALRETETLKV